MRSFQCLLCKRFHGNSDKPTCDAFVEGIPKELWLGKVDHDKPFKIKNELLYIPIDNLVRA